MSITNPETDAPKAVQDALAKHGGKVPGQDRPMWRLVLAQNCLIVANGIMHDLGDGEVSICAMGPDGKRYYQKPYDKVSHGRVEVPKYPCEGWVLEKWFSPQTWGSPEEWRSHKSEDGSTIMGEYPSRGDYWMLAGPFEKIPELADLRQAIDMHIQAMNRQPTNYANVLKQTILDQETAREQRRAKLESDLAYMRQNELVPVLKSGSLAAQRFRNQLNESTGDRSHLGAVHDA
ncbi:MAG: hypothetical protein WCA44_05755 [Acidobacteriaceae bacterium]